MCVYYQLVGNSDKKSKPNANAINIKNKTCQARSKAVKKYKEQKNSKQQL